MAASPQYITTPIISSGSGNTANTSRDGSGTLITVVTGATNGTRISKIDIVAIGTTTAGMMRLYVDDLTNKRLWVEVPVTAITPSATTAVFSAAVYPDEPLVLPNGYILKAAPHNAESFVIWAFGGNY